MTRTKAFTPDLNACHYTQIVTEPSSSKYMVTEVLGYDAWLQTAAQVERFKAAADRA